MVYVQILQSQRQPFQGVQYVHYGDVGFPRFDYGLEMLGRDGMEGVDS